MNPYVIYEDGMFKMYYAAGETYEPDVIAYATSKDGIKWNKYESNPILKASDNRFALDRCKVGACEVIRTSNNNSKETSTKIPKKISPNDAVPLEIPWIVDVRDVSINNPIAKEDPNAKSIGLFCESVNSGGWSIVICSVLIGGIILGDLE